MDVVRTADTAHQMTEGTVPNPDDAGRRDRARVHAALADPVRLAIVEALLDGDLAPDEVARAVDMPTNGLAHHLGVLTTTGLVVRRPSHGDGRRRYLTLDVSRLDGLVAERTWVVESVLFVCTANAARSQMAVALWRTCSDVPATSAGHLPADVIPVATSETLASHGLAPAASAPRGYADVGCAPGLVVSVCDVAREAGIPFDAPRLHWSIPDPLSDGGATAFDAAFRAIAARVDRLAPRVRAA